jgi:hypothetical protein
MARSKLLPEHLRNVADAFLVIEQAGRWHMSPFAVAQATAIVKGKLCYEGKLVAAALHSVGALKTRLAYTYTGAGPDRTVEVSAVLAGETETRSITVRYADAATSNEHWKKSPDQMLAYHGARVWARRFAPEVMLGVYSPEEFDVTPAHREPEHAGPTLDAAPEPVAPLWVMFNRRGQQTVTEAPPVWTSKWVELLASIEGHSSPADTRRAVIVQTLEANRQVFEAMVERGDGEHVEAVRTAADAAMERLAPVEDDMDMGEAA